MMPDAAVTAVHDLLMREAQTRLILEAVRDAWVELSHDERVMVDDISARLAAALVRIP